MLLLSPLSLIKGFSLGPSENSSVPWLPTQVAPWRRVKIRWEPLGFVLWLPCTPAWPNSQQQTPRPAGSPAPVLEPGPAWERNRGEPRSGAGELSAWGRRQTPPRTTSPIHLASQGRSGSRFWPLIPVLGTNTANNSLYSSHLPASHSPPRLLPPALGPLLPSRCDTVGSPGVPTWYPGVSESPPPPNGVGGRKALAPSFPTHRKETPSVSRGRWSCEGGQQGHLIPRGGLTLGHTHPPRLASDPPVDLRSPARPTECP